jgi:hypothetical protein
MSPPAITTEFPNQPDWAEPGGAKRARAIRERRAARRARMGPQQAEGTTLRSGSALGMLFTSGGGRSDLMA